MKMENLLEKLNGYRGRNMKDIIKRETVKDYTSWDLNAKCVRVKNRQELESKFKRKARRKNRENLRKMVDNLNYM
jgi:hypothetical protein